MMLDEMTERLGEFNNGIPGPNLERGRNPIYVPCDMTFNGRTWWYVGIRFKGNSSMRFSWSRGIYKLHFRLEFDQFEDDFPETDDQRLYGFKELGLSPGFADNSLLNEKVAADIFREAGVPSAKTAFYRLYIDHGQGSIYFGMYTMVEIPRKPLLEMQFGDGSGNLYKPEGSGATWVEFSQSSFAKKTNKDEEDWSDVIAVFEALHAPRTDRAAWRSRLEEVFDSYSFLRWLAMNRLMPNIDTYGGKWAHNYYIYGDPTQNGRLCWIPWDNNRALQGNSTLDMEEIGDESPLIRYLIDDPVYYAAYISYLVDLIEGVFALEATKDRMQAEHDLIEPYVLGDDGEQPTYSQLHSPAAFENSLSWKFDQVEQRHEAAQEFIENNYVVNVVVSFELSQNYPNPFNSTTTLAFRLSSLDNVKLVVYDIFGSEVAQILNEQMDAGRHVVTFDGDDLATGVYFAKLTSNGKTETRKMVLMK